MPKIRVHELAKELKITTKELMNIMSKQNINDKKTMSSLSDDEISVIKGFFSKQNEKVHTQVRKESPTINIQEAGKRKIEAKAESGNLSKQGESYTKSTQVQDRNTYNRDNRDNNNQKLRSSNQNNYSSQASQAKNGERVQRPNTENRYQRPRQDGVSSNYQNRQQGNKPYRSETSGDRQQRPPYRGDRPQQQDNRYQNRSQTSSSGQGDRRPIGQRPSGATPQGDRQQRPPYRGDRPQQQDNRYQNRTQTSSSGQGDRRPIGQRPQEGRSFGDKQDRFTSDRPVHRSNERGGIVEGARPKSFQKQTTPAVQQGNQQADRRRTKGKPTRPEERFKGRVRSNIQGDDTVILTATQKKKEKRKLQKKQTEERLLQEIEAAKAMENDIKTVQIGKNISVNNLAIKLNKPVQDIIMPLMKIGIMANVNQEIDFYTASKIAENFDIIVEPLDEIDILHEAFGTADDDELEKVERPPVVVVMGHVDHGKTSLLDAIRNTHVTDLEAGGITQRIGAYQVNIENKNITFLDTPGHEAFTAMRMRGAQVTDIAILVVAADDGVMPQTIEAINHAKAAEVEIIVAINKIDKPQSNLDRVKKELSEHGILSEDWGGKVICVPVSAKQGTGIDSLLETIILVAEIKELKANPHKRAMGTVIDANLDRGKGPVATVLVQDGSLSVGYPIVAGSTHGKVRAMMDHKGTRVKKVGPSTPVEIIGLEQVPKAGDMFYVAASEKQAGQVAAEMVAKTREDMIKPAATKISLDDLFSQIKAGNVKDLNIVIKADVQGSVEAVRNSLERLSNEEVRIRTIHGGVGQVTESDIMLASASNAIIIGFNVRYDNSAKQIADSENVDIRLYRVIYNAIEDISSAMKGLLDPIFQEKVIGHAEIRQLFRASGVSIAGVYVADGKLLKTSKVRIVRDGKVIYEGELAALRRFKDEVKEVAAGYECGLSFNKYNDIKEGDKIEAYIMEEVAR